MKKFFKKKNPSERITVVDPHRLISHEPPYTLSEKQRIFTRLLASLIEHSYRNGYELTLGEAWRSHETAKAYARAGKGIKNSLHRERLAIDLNLFYNGKYLTKTKDYKTLGEYWESLSSPDLKCNWGGYFKDSNGRSKPDGNHFSIAYKGRK